MREDETAHHVHETTFHTKRVPPSTPNISILADRDVLLLDIVVAHFLAIRTLVSLTSPKPRTPGGQRVPVLHSTARRPGRQLVETAHQLVTKKIGGNPKPTTADNGNRLEVGTGKYKGAAAVLDYSAWGCGSQVTWSSCENGVTSGRCDTETA
ncbi:hypothetical protein J6590_004104 [Homalodisca vitripennis]|nr:hypothetical protein J6590_004104 [Homalodisca vitripennis]